MYVLGMRYKFGAAYVNKCRLLGRVRPMKRCLKKWINCCPSQRERWSSRWMGCLGCPRTWRHILHAFFWTCCWAVLRWACQFHLGIKAGEISEEGRSSWSSIKTRSRQDEVLHSSCLRWWVNYKFRDWQKSVPGLLSYIQRQPGRTFSKLYSNFLA